MGDYKELKRFQKMYCLNCDTDKDLFFNEITDDILCGDCLVDEMDKEEEENEV